MRNLESRIDKLQTWELARAEAFGQERSTEIANWIVDNYTEEEYNAFWRAWTLEGYTVEQLAATQRAQIVERFGDFQPDDLATLERICSAIPVDMMERWTKAGEAYVTMYDLVHGTTGRIA